MVVESVNEMIEKENLAKNDGRKGEMGTGKWVRARGAHIMANNIP